ncbi:MAG: hypothetical protein ABIX28_25465 [Vicinamibacterales bacterium]
MILWLLLSLVVGPVPRPSAPANTQVRDAADAVASSGEDAYIVWTVEATKSGMSYEISLDDGPWVPVSPAALRELEPGPKSKVRTYAVNRGKLTPGRHTVEVRECVRGRSVCAASASYTVTVIPPVDCAMSPWGPWTEWTEWARAGALDVRHRSRHRTVKVFPGVGAAPCPSTAETVDETRAYVPPPMNPVTVAYVRMDATTKGTWKGVYGSDGQAFAGAPAAALPFVTVTPMAASDWTWAPSTTDERGLQRPGAAADRLASTWYSASALELDLRFRDALVHEVALYAVDWDGLERAQTIEVLDSRGGVLHQVSTGPTLRTGVYYVWRISGHARIRVTRTSGANAVVFGLLFGSTTQP